MRKLLPFALIVVLLVGSCAQPGEVTKPQADAAARQFAETVSTTEHPAAVMDTVRQGSWWESTVAIGSLTTVVLFISPEDAKLAGLECPDGEYQTMAVFQSHGGDGRGCWLPITLAEPTKAPTSVPTETAPAAAPVYEPVFEPADCPFELLAREAGALEVECGYLVVPEKRDDPASRTIRLAVATMRHPGGAPEPDPIVYLVGGPGGSILEIVSQTGVFSMFGPLMAANRDIVLLDQRGVGYSRPVLDCPEFGDLYLDLLDFEVDGQEVDAPERLDRKVQALWDCAGDLRQVADLTAYNTAENAADVEDLRQALGYEQVNLWGASYGARLALEVLRNHPQGLRSVMVEAAYPPESDIFLETPSDFDRSLSLLVEECAADEACAKAYPDLRGLLFDTVDQLNTAPVEVEVAHPISGQRYPMRIGGDTLLELVFRSLYATAMRSVLPQAILDASQSSFDALLLIASQDVWRQDMRSWGMYMSVLCHEEIPFSSPEAFAAELVKYPEFAGMFQGFEVGNLTYGACEGWDAGQADASANEPVRSDVPTLLLAGQFDPIAPPQWGQRVAEALDHGYFFEYPGMGHGVSDGTCPQQMMLAFLADPASQPDDACIGEMTMASFVVPAETAEVVMEPFSSETFGFSGVKPGGWEEIAPGVYNRGQGPTDAARLIQQAAPGATVEQLKVALTGQLGVEAFPESSTTLETDAFTWQLYQVEIESPVVGTVVVDLALAEMDQSAYIVLLQALADEADSLRHAVFQPSLQALSLPGEKPDKNVYEHPEGFFTVPIPTNWTAEQREGYAVLTSPDGEVAAYVLALEGDDLEQAVADGWQVVVPGFDLEVDDIIDEPLTNNAERAITIVYDTGEDEERIVIAGGWLYDGVAYLEMFETRLEPYQKRAYQLAIISSGYEIAALEEDDLSTVQPLPLAEVLPELEGYIAEKMEQLDVVGAALAIVQEGEVVYAKGFGMRDLESQEPVTPETLMMIGSSGKSLTTLYMAQQVDQGTFQWDTKVVDVLPTFQVADPQVTDKITMRNLVCACSGVPRRDLEWLFNADELTAEGIVESLVDFEFFTDFGEAFQYSNQMVATGGYLAALAAGGQYGDLYDAYEQQMQENVLEPIGMPNTTFAFDEALAEANHATPYAQTPLDETVVVPWEVERTLSLVAPAGALWSNVLDMGNYLITELNQGVTPDGRRIVSAENLAVTWEPQVDITADASYGLGWIVEDHKGVKIISHGGNTFGFTSELAFLPDHGLGISILTNQRVSPLNQVVRYRLVELLFQEEPQIDEQLQFGLDLGEESRARLRASVQESIDQAAVEPNLGNYAHDALGDMTLSWRDGRLIMDVGEFEIEIRSRQTEEGEITYGAYTPSAVAGMPVELKEDEEGNPVVVFGVGVVEYTYEKAY